MKIDATFANICMVQTVAARTVGATIEQGQKRGDVFESLLVFGASSRETISGPAAIPLGYKEKSEKKKRLTL